VSCERLIEDEGSLLFWHYPCYINGFIVIQQTRCPSLTLLQQHEK